MDKAGDDEGAVQEDGAISEFFDALNAHEEEHIRRILAPDFTFEEVARSGEASVAAFMIELGMIFSGFPDIMFRPVRKSAESGRIYVEFRAIGTHKAEFLSVPATGMTAIISGVFNLGIDNQSVRSLRMTVDFGGLRRQLLLASRR